MLSYNEISQRKLIDLDGEPYEVIESQVSRKQANKPVNKTKLKNLFTGRVVDHTFHVSDKVTEADVRKEIYLFLYVNEKTGEIFFCEKDNPKNRFAVDEVIAGEIPLFFTEKSEVSALVYTDKEDEEKIVGFRLPPKVTLTVTEAPPAVKGNTATGGDKKVTLETGLVVTTPLFIDSGDTIVVSTSTKEYTERASKA